jgi:hypothetical protein
MHAVSYRPHCLVLALVTLGLLVATGLRPSRHRSCSYKKARIAKQLECPHTRAYSVQLADAWYRGKRFDAAEQTLRDAAKCEQVKVAEELQTIASFYHQLGFSYRSALETTSASEAIRHLDWAIQFDAMLGGAHADELSLRRNRNYAAVGPQ